MSSSPLYSPPPEIARVEREAERRLAAETKVQLEDERSKNRIWQKECQGLKDKLAEKKKESTLARNEAFDLTTTLSNIASHLGFDSTQSLLDYLRASSQHRSLQDVTAALAQGEVRIASLESQLAESAASNSALAAELDAESKQRQMLETVLQKERISRDSLSSMADALRAETDGLRRQLETEKHHADGLAFLVREESDWRDQESKMEEEATALRAELAEAQAEVAGLRRELENKPKAVTSSSQPLGENTTANAPSSTPRTRSSHASTAHSRPPKVDASGGQSKPAHVARLEALLESSRAECALLQAKNKKQKEAWKTYAQTYPAVLDAVRAKEDRRSKRRDSRAISSSAVSAIDGAERSPKRMRIESTVVCGRGPAAIADADEVENQQPALDADAAVSVVKVQPSPRSSPRGRRFSPLSSPRHRPPTRPSSAAEQRLSSLAPTVVGSSSPVQAPGRLSSPLPGHLEESALTLRRVETSAAPTVNPTKGETVTVKKEKKKHPLGQQAFGPQDLLSSRSIGRRSSSTVGQSLEDNAPDEITASDRPPAGLSRPVSLKQTSNTGRHQLDDKAELATPARSLGRAESTSLGPHTTPTAHLTPAMRDRMSASRRWLGKAGVVNGQAATGDPLDQEIPEGEPFTVPRQTPRATSGTRPKSHTDPSSSSRVLRDDTPGSSKARRPTGSHDSPLPPLRIKSEPDDDKPSFSAGSSGSSRSRPAVDAGLDARRGGDASYRSSLTIEEDEDRRRAMADPTKGMTPEEKSIFLKKQRNVPASVTREMYAAFKGRGRYADEMTPTGGIQNKTINDEFQINRARNDGKDYAYNSVVRGKDARKQLHAVDCECCRGYYEAVGPLAPLPKGPRWRSPEADEVDENGAGPSRSRPAETEQQRTKRKRDEEIDSHRQEISRHRNEWDGPATPPHYWDIGFPSTQKVAQINAAADKLDEEKRARVEAEARKADGKYQRRG